MQRQIPTTKSIDKRTIQAEKRHRSTFRISGAALLTSIALGIFILSSANQWLARQMLDWHARWSKLWFELTSQSTLAKGLGRDEVPATRFLLDKCGLLSPDRSGCRQSRSGFEWLVRSNLTQGFVVWHGGQVDCRSRETVNVPSLRTRLPFD